MFKRRRAQSAIEYLLVIATALVIVGVLIWKFITSTESTARHVVNTGESLVNKSINNATST